jgi:hypothetical protein
VGRENLVFIATRYGLDGPGIESRWWRDIQHPSRPDMRPTQPPIQWVPGPFPGGKEPGRGVNYPPPSSARVKERVELYHYSPSGPPWPVLWRTLPLPIIWTHYIYVTQECEDWWLYFETKGVREQKRLGTTGFVFFICYDILQYIQSPSSR